MIHSPVTAGERLCVVLHARVVDPAEWDKLRHSFGLARRADEYVELFREILAVNLTCRIVALGRSLAAEKATNDPVYESMFKKAIGEVIGIPRSAIPQVFRNATDAVESAAHDFTPKERQTLRRGSQAREERCYMCGARLDYLGTGRPHEAYTLEHVWPRAFGGDSIDENALPACASCNQTKANFATWGMVAVQSLILGLTPRQERLEEIDKTFKFAIHYRAARKLSHVEECSMGQAFRRLGPWRLAELLESDDVADFFNLRNYRPDVRI